MGYDDVLPHLGSFGPYQRRIFFLVSLPAISCAFHKLAGVFLLAKPDYRCLMPFEAQNASFTPSDGFLMNMSYPWDALNSKWSTCDRLVANFTDSYFESGHPANATERCDRWAYDRSKYESSTVTEWDMVCSKSWLTATSDSLFMVGVLLGSIIFGHLSDKMGRKPIFFASLVIQVVFGVLAGIAPEYLTYTISRIVVGATTSGVFLVAYVLAMEMVGPTWRLFAGTVMMMFFSVGYMLTAGFAYFFTDWRSLQIALTLPGLLFLCYWWFIPESARWLLSKRRKDDAVATIQKAAEGNKKTIPQDVLDNLLEPERKEDIDKPAPSLFDLFRYPNLRKKSLLIFFDWFVNSGTYYGLSWNTNNLGGNDLLNFVISGAVEIPAYTFLLFTLNRWGRKTILCGCMLTAGAMLLLTMAVPETQNWLIVVLAMLGKLAITASYGTIYIFSAEQFPTVIRNVGLGAASMFARFGGILAPYFNLLGDIWKPFPLIIFGAMAFVGGLLSLFLPETLNRPLPDTIAEGERFGKKEDPIENGGNAEEMVELKHSTNGDVQKFEEA
ncbi:Organic cation transporter protein [Sergentomyia squamirostris]